MAGKHRKTSRPAAVVAMVVAPAGLAAAAMAATTMTTGIATDTTEAAKPPQSVDLLALITPANSTAQIFAGTTYYGTNYANTTYAPQQVVPFLAGPQGIATAISDANDGSAPTSDRTVVLASGWGAGQTGTALAGMSTADKSDIDLVILDNNTNRAAGGFWTTYAPFAPLLGTSAEPTPSDLNAHVLDVGYEYNINGNAPTDPTNPFALGNSLAAYAFGYGGEQTADVPVEAINEAKGSSTAVHNHYVVAPDGTYTKTPLPGSSTTYVTFESENLPLTRGLRLLPGGDIVADAIDPTLTELVNAGYQNGQPIPTDPRVPQPMTPGSSLSNLDGVPGSVPIGLAKGGATAQQDIADPTKLVTKPVAEFGNLPVISGGGAGLPSLPGFSTTGGNLFTPGTNNKPAGAASTGGANPVKSFTDQVNDAVKKVTGGLTGAKPASDDES